MPTARRGTFQTRGRKLEAGRKRKGAVCLKQAEGEGRRTKGR